MLEVLKKYSPMDKERLLSRVALALMPDPGIDPEPTLNHEEELFRRKILAKFDPSKPHDKARIFELLSKEISNAAFARVKKNEVKARVGQKGLLRADSYNIKLSQSFKKLSMPYGIRQSHVEDALYRPDAVEHLLPSDFGQPSDQVAFSLYLKSTKVQQLRNAFTLIVVSHRVGAVQNVTAAWRIYHSEIDLSHSRRPLDAWKDFAERYGVQITVGSVTAKFVIYEKIPIIGSKTDFIKGFLKEEGHFYQHFFLREKNGFFEVAYAFMLDVKKYISDLLEHGVHVDLQKLPKKPHIFGPN